MKIKVTGKNIGITTAISNYIENKLGKLEKWQADIIHCQATVSLEPGNQQKIEVSVNIPKNHLIASASHSDLYTAINNVEHKLERQLNKLQHKPESKRTNQIEPFEIEEV